MANESKDLPVLGSHRRPGQGESGFMQRVNSRMTNRDRLGKIKVELDQCWDLLRQRRALRELGVTGSSKGATTEGRRKYEQ